MPRSAEAAGPDADRQVGEAASGGRPQFHNPTLQARYMRRSIIWETTCTR